MVQKQVFKTSRKRANMGFRIQWTLPKPGGGMEHYRNLEFSYLGDQRSHYKIKMGLFSSLSSHWTISAGVRLEKGGVFVFEKTSEGLHSPKAKGPWVTAAGAAERPRKAEKQLETWWKAPLRPAFLLRQVVVARRQNLIEFEMDRLLTGCPNTIKTKSAFRLTYDRNKPMVVITLNPVFQEKSRSYKAYYFRSLFLWDNKEQLLAPAKESKEQEGVFLVSGKGELRTEAFKKSAFFRLNVLKP